MIVTKHGEGGQFFGEKSTLYAETTITQSPRPPYAASARASVAVLHGSPHPALPMKLICPSCARRTHAPVPGEFSPTDVVFGSITMTAEEYRHATWQRRVIVWAGQCPECGCDFTIYEGDREMAEKIARTRAQKDEDRE